MTLIPRSFGAWLGAGTALAVLALPAILNHSFVFALITQIVIMSIFALSYNMLFGQCGMLSFGHSVFFGLAAFATAHAMNALAALPLPTPIALVPLIGGLTGLAFGAVFGALATRTTGAVFALVTLAIGELVRAALYLTPSLSGGESGIVTNRVIGLPLLGITFDLQRETYLLTIAWMILCVGLMRFTSRTPMGRIATAVRDNPQRAAFTGYDVSYVRFLQFCLGAFFAGIAGALSVINFEFVSSEAVSLASSGGVLIAVVLGGSRYFAGPVAGAIAYVLFVSLFSTLSEAWMFYLGALFLLVIRFVPDGLAGGLVALGAAWRHSERNQRIATIAHGLSMSSVAIGAVGLVEALYRSAKPEHATTISTISGQHGLGQIESLTVPLILLLAGVTVLVFFQRRRSPVPKRKGDD